MNLSSPSLKPLSVCTAFGGSMLCQEFCFAFTCGLSNPCSLAASSPSPFWSVLTHPEQLHFSTLCGPQPQFSSHAHLWGSTPFLTCYSEYTHSDHNLFSLITVSWGLPPCLPVGLSMISTFGTFSPFLSSLHAVFCSTNILGDSLNFLFIFYLLGFPSPFQKFHSASFQPCVLLWSLFWLRVSIPVLLLSCQYVVWVGPHQTFVLPTPVLPSPFLTSCTSLPWCFATFDSSSCHLLLHSSLPRLSLRNHTDDMRHNWPLPSSSSPHLFAAVCFFPSWGFDIQCAGTEDFLQNIIYVATQLKPLCHILTTWLQQLALLWPRETHFLAVQKVQKSVLIILTFSLHL